MKISNILVLNFILLSVPLSAQMVGIGINSPIGAFHIDTKSNTVSNTNSDDDIVVTTDGNVGIGILNPSNKLEVKGNAIIDQNDYVTGDITTQELHVNGTLRAGLFDLNNLTDKLETYGNVPQSAFRFDNGTQKINDVPGLSMLPVLGLKRTAPGSNIFSVHWKNLPDVTTFRVGGLNNNVVLGGPGSNHPLIVTDITADKSVDGINTGELVLTEGIWLIMAKIATEDQQSNHKTGFNIYLKLFSNQTANKTVTQELTPFTQIASAAETSGWEVSTPQLEYFIKVPPGETRYIRAGVSTSLSSTTYKTTTNFGGSYFIGIRLDYPQD